jgi:hypothetical protein
MSDKKTTKWRWAMASLLLIALLAVIPHSCDLVKGNVPMTLYGRVVDQMGNAAPGAALTFEASARPRFSPPSVATDDSVKWRVQATAGPDGTFTIHGGWGQTLFLKSISGPRYAQACLYLTFNYGWKSTDPIYHPEPANPVVFMCWNDAFKRIISGKMESTIAMDSEGVAFRSGRISKFGTGDENFAFRVIRPPGNPKRPYEWSVAVDGLYGKVQKAAGELGAEAPREGYTKKLREIMAANDPAWSPQMRLLFYSQAPDLGPGQGPKIHARVDMSAIIADNNQDVSVTIKYAANFGNSRDLTPGPVVPAKN